MSQGVFRFKNSASTDEIKAADVGTVCFLVDDETVAKTDDSIRRNKAGVVVGVPSASSDAEMRLSFSAPL